MRTAAVSVAALAAMASLEHPPCPAAPARESGAADAPKGSVTASLPSRQPPPAVSKPQIPTAWLSTGSKDGYTFLTDHEIAHTGSSSAVLRSMAGQAAPDSLTAVFQACNATDFRGSRAQFTIYLSGEDDFGTAEAWMRVDGPATPIKTVRVPAALPGLPEWAPVSVTIDVPSNSAVLTYGVILHGSGRLWMDSARLAVIDEKGVARDAPSPDPGAVDLTTGPAPRHPRNMDFEQSVTAP